MSGAGRTRRRPRADALPGTCAFAPAHHKLEGADAVFTADFFAFGVGAAVVGDGDFIDEETALSRTRGGDDFQKMSLNQSGKMAGIFWERNRR